MDARALITSLAGGLVLAVSVVLALSSGSAAQTGSVAPDGNLQVSWSDSAMADGWRAVCGDVRNVGQVPVRGVALRVVGLNGARQVVSTRNHCLLADVPTGSRAVFCVPMPAGATSYDVMVLRADRGSVEAP